METVSASAEGTESKEGGGKNPPNRWRPHLEHVVAVLVVLALIGLSHWHLWTFSDAPPKPLNEQVDPGIAQYLLADPDVLALVQLATGALAAFLVVSFAVHMTNRRWLRGLTSSGWSVDDRPTAGDLKTARETINSLTDRIHELEATAAQYAAAIQQAEDGNKDGH